MIAYKTKLKPWGNSLGIVVPKSKLSASGIGKNRMVRVTISSVRELTAGDIFGAMPGIAGSVEKDLREIDEELDSKI
jgi:hypothetical protein